MSGNRGCFLNTVLFLVIILIPIVGHIMVTLMILEDDHSVVGKVLWLLVVWLFPIPVVIGPLLYMLFGQRPRSRSRIAFGQPSY